MSGSYRHERNGLPGALCRNDIRENRFCEQRHDTIEEMPPTTSIARPSTIGKVVTLRVCARAKRLEQAHARPPTSAAYG